MARSTPEHGGWSFPLTVLSQSALVLLVALVAWSLAPDEESGALYLTVIGTAAEFYALAAAGKKLSEGMASRTGKGFLTSFLSPLVSAPRAFADWLRRFPWRAQTLRTDPMTRPNRGFGNVTLENATASGGGHVGEIGEVARLRIEVEELRRAQDRNAAQAAEDRRLARAATDKAREVAKKAQTDLEVWVIEARPSRAFAVLVVAASGLGLANFSGSLAKCAGRGWLFAWFS